MEEKYIQEVPKYRKRKKKRYHGKHKHEYLLIYGDNILNCNSLKDVLYLKERCILCKKENYIYNVISYCNNNNIQTIKQLQTIIERNVEYEKNRSK